MLREEWFKLHRSFAGAGVTQSNLLAVNENDPARSERKLVGG